MLADSNGSLEGNADTSSIEQSGYSSIHDKLSPKPRDKSTFGSKDLSNELLPDSGSDNYIPDLMARLSDYERLISNRYLNVPDLKAAVIHTNDESESKQKPIKDLVRVPDMVSFIHTYRGFMDFGDDSIFTKRPRISENNTNTNWVENPIRRGNLHRYW